MQLCDTINWIQNIFTLCCSKQMQIHEEGNDIPIIPLITMLSGPELISIKHQSYICLLDLCLLDTYPSYMGQRLEYQYFW